ncbi:MAG: TIGR01906 family membrane protein [Clostridiales bacterium]|nr:TIGR01906 family membrane protein [Clostridiales bacterium]
MKNALNWTLAVVFGLTLIPALMLSAADGVMFSAQLYRRAYEKYDRPAAIGIDANDLMDVTQRLLGYMKGREPDLIIEKEIGGVVQEVFGERERLHMVDVRRLVLGAMRIRLLCAAAAAMCLAALAVRLRGRAVAYLARGFLWSLAVWGALLTALGVYMLVDFSDAFWNFHLLFFDNDLWLLDPATDVMINMFPEAFFNDMALAIVWRAVLFIAIPAIGAALLTRREKTHD